MPCITHVLSFHHRQYHIIDTKKARYHDAVYEISHFVLFWKQYIILHRLAQPSIILLCLASSCIILHHLASSCIVLHHLALPRILLHHLAASCIVLHYLASSCIILHHLASSCIILRTETPINTTNVNSFFVWKLSHKWPKQAQYHHDAMNDTCYFIFVWTIQQKWAKKIGTMRL